MSTTAVASYNGVMVSTDSPIGIRVPVADALLDALDARDFDSLAGLFEPDAVVQAALPDGLHEWTGPERITAAFFRWFGRVEECELLTAAVALHGPRLQMRWRARVRGGHFGDAPFLVEQHVYADPGATGRIQTMSLLCSGFVLEREDVRRSHGHDVDVSSGDVDEALDVGGVRRDDHVVIGGQRDDGGIDGVALTGLGQQQTG